MFLAAAIVSAMVYMFAGIGEVAEAIKKIVEMPALMVGLAEIIRTSSLKGPSPKLRPKPNQNPNPDSSRVSQTSTTQIPANPKQHQRPYTNPA